MPHQGPSALGCLCCSLLAEHSPSHMFITSLSTSSHTNWLQGGFWGVPSPSVLHVFPPVFAPSGLFPTDSSQVPTMNRGARVRFSLRRIPSVWTSSCRRPSSTAAPRGPRPAAAPKTTTTTRNAGRSESSRAPRPVRRLKLSENPFPHMSRSKLTFRIR